LNKNPPVNELRPSVDVLMKSVADIYGKNVLGIILTGMGSDGAKGMREIKVNGGRTITQDEHSSLIFGMPARVIENGDADIVLPLSEISKKIMEWV